MDERELKELLEAEQVPPPDENARKQALNLAMAAFDDAQHEKNTQGVGLLGRLIGRKTQSKGRPMRKSHVFGGMATAMALVLAVGIGYKAFEIDDQGLVQPTPATGGEQPDVSGEPETSQADKPKLVQPAEKDRLGKGVTGNQDKKTDTDGVSSTLAQPKNERSGSRQDEERAAAGALRNAPATVAAPPPAQSPAPVTEVAPEPSAPVVQRMKKPDSTLSLSDDVRGRSGVVTGGGTPRAKLKQSLAVQRSKTMQRSKSQRSFRGQGFTAGPGIVAMPRPVPPPGDIQQRQYEAKGRDQFADVAENAIKRVADAPVSTFSVDVDTASYSFMRRKLKGGVLPQKNAVRVEELVNYFDYDYPLAETRERPFKPTVTVMPSPWKTGNKLIQIGIKGYDIAAKEKPRSNLVFLLDVSGSMNRSDKLPLMVNSMKLLLDTLGPDDTVAIVTYAGRAGTVLEPTKVAEKGKILAALDRLGAGGSTAGAAGVRQAYALARSTFDKKAVNRVILATDGDFNVGITNRNELKGFVERNRKTGVFLSVLGFGQGNLNDHMMQTLAQNGNGVAAHIDTLSEARKVLVDEASSTLFPIAKDVKIQVEFNPAKVAEYRLIGYETRALKREDFNNDKVDAGDIGAGHTVTAIYEITPVGGERMIADSRYRANKEAKSARDFSGEYAFLKIRYKLPKEDTSKLITTPITTAQEIDGKPDGGPEAITRVREARWATAVAAFGQILKGGKYTGGYSYDDVIAMARSARGDDEFGYRAEFINLVRLARSASALPR